MSRYISGRYKKTPQSGLTSDRYRYLSPGDAEPNLGDPPTINGTPDLPAGQQYIVISFLDRPGERFWIPNQGGLIPGAISVFEEDTLVGGLSSTTQLNFEGNAITADGVELPQPGVAVTITVAPPGDNNSVLFKNNDDFATDSRFTFNDGFFTAGDRITVGTGGTVITTTLGGLVGIGTTNPTQKLHLDGNFRITGTIYDSTNQPGTQGDLIVKGENDELLWVNPNSVQAGAGGTVGQIQFHNTAGLVDGAENFYFDYINNRVGIGSTIPTQLLDVLGVSTFSGGVNVDTLTATQNSTFEKNLDVEGNLTVDGILEVDGLSDLDELKVVGIATFNDNIEAKKDLDIDGKLDVDGHTELDNLGVSGIATFSSELQIDDTGNLNVLGPSVGVAVTLAGNAGITTTGGDLYVGGDLYIKDDLTFDHLTANTGTFNTSLDIQGITTTDTLKVGTNPTVSITSILDEDDMESDSDTALATQQSIKAYVDNQITAQDLDFAGDTGTGAVDLDSQTFKIEGTTNEIVTAGSGTTLTIGLPDNVIVSGILTVNGNTTLGNDATVDTVSFGSTISSAFIPSADDTYNIGSADYKWNNVYATTFNGAFQGTADNADKLTTPRKFTLGEVDNGNKSDDIVSIARTFDGSANVGFALTLTNTGVEQGAYGSSTQVGIVTVDTKGRVTSASNVDINFADASVDIANKLKTPRKISFNEDVVAVGKTFDGTENVGFALTLVNKGPGEGTYGGEETKVLQLQLDDKGRITGLSSVSIDFGNANVATADSLTDSRNIAATGDITWNVDFKGHENVTADATLATVVTGNTVGSSTQVGVVTFDDKGRITAASNVDIDFGNATVDKAGYAHTAGIATNLKGGEAYQIPYQSAANTTQFISNGTITGQLLQYNQGSAPSWVSAADLTAGIANSLSGGAAGSIPYQSGTNTTVFLDEPNADNRVLTYNNTSEAPEWKELSTIVGAGYTLLAVDDGNNVILRLSDGTDNDDVLITAGSNITIDTVTEGGFTIAAVAGAGIGIAASASDVLNVNNAEIGAVDATDDKIVFYDDSQEKLTYLDVGTGLTIDDSTITVDVANVALDKIIENDTSAEVVDTGSDGHFKVITDGTEKLRVTSTGNVGIGSTIPATKLDVFGNIKLSDTNPEIQFNTGGPRFRVPADNTLTIHSGGNSGTGDLERLRIGSSGQIGLGGANYGTSGQVLTSQGPGAGVTWSDASSIGVGATDKISEGDSKAEIIDTVSESKFTVEIDATEIFSVDSDSPKIHRQDSSIEGGSLVFNRAVDDVAAFELDVYGSSSSDSGRFRIIDQTQPGGEERFEIGPAGQIGLGGANYGTSGQVLTSGGPGAGVTWADASGGSGTLTDIDVKLYSDNNTPRTEYSCSNPIDVTVSAGIATIGIGTTSNAYGKRYIGPDEPTVDVCDGDIWYDTSTGGGSDSFSQDPVGTIVAWSGSISNIPTGYQLCDGTTAQSLTLREIVGTNVPDLRDRFIVGATDGGSGTYPGIGIGSTGGRADSIVPSHTHNVANQTGTGPNWIAFSRSDIEPDTGSEGSADGTGYQSGPGSQANDRIFTIASQGEDAGNKNLPPFYALAYIIKHSSVSVTLNVSAGDKIEEGNTKAEVVDTGSDGHFKVVTEAIERLRVTSDGFVGIGSITPEGVLDINSTTGDANVIIRTFSDNLGNTQILFGDSDNNDSGKIQYNHPENFLAFRTNFSEQLRITSNGSVGIGTTNPEGSQNSNPLFATKLDVFKSFVGGGDGSFVGRFYGLDTDVEETSVRFITKGTGGNAADLHNASDAYLMHGISNGDTKFVFGANGDVGIGTTLPGSKLDVDGTLNVSGVSTLANAVKFTTSGSDDGIIDLIPGGTLFIRGGSVVDGKIKLQAHAGYDNVICDLGPTELHYAASGGTGGKKFETTGYGVSVYGKVAIASSIYDSNGNTGTEGQVLSSVPGIGVSWTDQTGGSGGSGNSGGGIELLSPKTATGTAVTFTDIPAGAKEIKLMFSEVGVGDTANHLLVQLGTSSTWIDSGYYASSEAENGMTDVSASDGFPIHNRNDTDSTGNRFTGSMIINLFKTSSSKTYTQIGQFKRYSTSDDCEDCASACQTFGNVDSISGDITRIRVLANHTGSGQSFTNGEINVSYGSGGSGDGSGGDITLLPAQTIDSAAEATSVEFTDIPSNALEIAVIFEGVSLSGTNNLEIQLGTSSGYIASNYDSLSQDESGGNEGLSTSSFIIGSGGASETRTGSMLIKKASSTSYVQTGQFAVGPNTGISPVQGGTQIYGSLSSVSGTVNKLRIKSSDSDHFDAGSISVSYKTASSGSGGGGTVSSGTFTASAGSPSTLDSYTYDSAELVFEYTVFVKNGSDYQTQKLLVMRDGTTVDSTQYAVMFSNGLLVQLDATISGGNVNLRATPETGVNGSTTYRIKREVI